MFCPHCNSKNHSRLQDYSKYNLNVCSHCNKTFVEKKMQIGKGTKIWELQLSNIHTTVEIGTNCRIHSHVWIGEGVKIGNNVKIQAFAFLPPGVIIEDDVFIGPHACFTNDRYPPSHGAGLTITIVHKGAVIGAGATILPGCHIGQGSKVGAGAVVTRPVTSGVVVCGNPAKIHNSRTWALREGN